MENNKKLKEDRGINNKRYNRKKILIFYLNDKVIYNNLRFVFTQTIYNLRMRY